MHLLAIGPRLMVRVSTPFEPRRDRSNRQIRINPARRRESSGPAMGWNISVGTRGVPAGRGCRGARGYSSIENALAVPKVPSLRTGTSSANSGGCCGSDRSRIYQFRICSTACDALLPGKSRDRYVGLLLRFHHGNCEILRRMVLQNSQCVALGIFQQGFPMKGFIAYTETYDNGFLIHAHGNALPVPRCRGQV
jgi:hypothetical protein